MTEKYLDPKGGSAQEAGEDRTIRRYITCKLHQILLRWSSQGGWDDMV